MDQAIHDATRGNGVSNVLQRYGRKLDYRLHYGHQFLHTLETFFFGFIG